ncbi:MAG: hypothetical protein AB7O24_12935 [Kofleriaceae bacterium]
MSSLTRLSTVLGVVGALAACASTPGETTGEDLDGDGKADSGAPNVTNDNLNGIWNAQLDGQPSDDIVIQSWWPVGIHLKAGDKSYELRREESKLAGEGVDLTIQPNGPGPKDDTIDGTIDGVAVLLERDTEVKPPIAMELPRDRSYRSLMWDTVLPAAHLDRESYFAFDAAKMSAWLQEAALYKSGSLTRNFKGDTTAEQKASLDRLLATLDGFETSPRSMILDETFSGALKAELKDGAPIGLMLTNMNLYFSAAAGRSLVFPLTDDAMVYFITDRPSRTERLGLVVMDAPSRDPLASTFGRQLLDLAEMPPDDALSYTRAMVELLLKSDPSTAGSLSELGRTALVDWFGVMMIEDYRGMAFGGPGQGWGYNVSNAQFYGLIAQALARPGEVDSMGNPIIGQIILDGQLRPGDGSYIDVDNNGNDLQESYSTGLLKKYATDYLAATHPELIAELKASIRGVPGQSIGDQARYDVFHYLLRQIYDSKRRNDAITGAEVDRVVNATVALIETLRAESHQLEEYILTHPAHEGAPLITKSNEPAPRSTGF